MNNNITINIEEIRKLPDDSITHPETIRQIALYGMQANECCDDLYKKIRTSCEVFGLYPHVQSIHKTK